ncbi:bifunctional acetate--CoA ligase family protein/GNAT family N-acetyltransferase [Chelativorans sp. Marseille-P2723]|uniref:bifunctional acetate--CoA ligase family protein/GNAT family N-acetyltransferase n=1 Tax=Chelativorans sp. Marseille-P2723 TaxID=2709133 RepID=UPI00156E9750|nr:bifunctional acetate--CoA ligase family protein/GNAT family N-acetyltransferase [Chelativorans sp. Marseille-P2723]
MTIRNLEFAVTPQSLAIFGASERFGSVGRMVMENVLAAGFEGEVWPINPKYRVVCGRPCFAHVRDLPVVPDLAVIVTPARTVPQIIRELGEKGNRAAVVISAGLTRENGLRQAMLDAAKPFLLRVIGPNTLGLIVPPEKLNASFSHITPSVGGIALLSQSGAITTTLLDWAAEEGIGFSHVVSLGDMADVDVGDYLDLLAGDAKTRAILLYLESIPEPRKFMSAARAASRIKPVIGIKAGRHAEAAEAAATHTGALAGSDRVVEAAFSRAGILRVRGLDELFAATETVARFQKLERSRVGIVTNGGGAGVLVVDRLMDLKADLASLSDETMRRLDESLPKNWSRANPVDIIGDAPPERYRAAVQAVAADAGTDAVLVINCPTALASPADAARAIAALTQGGRINGKPVLTSWLGEKTAREGRSILQNAGVSSYNTPALAAAAVSHLSHWSRAQKSLMRVPSSRAADIQADIATAHSVLRKAAAEGRRILTEPEAKVVIGAYRIPVPETVIARSPDEVADAARRLLQSSKRLVVKLLSRTITHKSDVGGVVLDLLSPEAANQAARNIEDALKRMGRAREIDGYVVQPMIKLKNAHELILGLNRDEIFGPVLLFGAGGTAVEVLDDTAIALPPLDDVLAGDLIDQTRIGRLLAGYRDRPPADRAGIIAALSAVSQLIVDFPCIVSMDINPLLASNEGVMALDARIEIEPERVEQIGPNPALAIRPYPADWSKDVTLGDDTYHLRPIEPADVSLYPPFFEKVAPEDIRLRLLAPRRNFPHEMLLRLTQLDYDREIAFVALRKDTGELAGIVRLSSDPDRERAEFGILVRTDLQGRGLGWELLNHAIDYGRSEGLAHIEGYILAENTGMLRMSRDFGFRLTAHQQEPGVTIAVLDLQKT